MFSTEKGVPTLTESADLSDLVTVRKQIMERGSFFLMLSELSAKVANDARTD